MHDGSRCWGQIIEFSENGTVKFWREETVRGTNGTSVTNSALVTGKYIKLKDDEYRLEMDTAIEYKKLN
jgi:hypothetical protein